MVINQITWAECRLILNNFLSPKQLSSPPQPNVEAHPAKGTAGRHSQQGPCPCIQNEHFCVPDSGSPAEGRRGAGPASPGRLHLPLLHPFLPLDVHSGLSHQTLKCSGKTQGEELELEVPPAVKEGGGAVPAPWGRGGCSSSLPRRVGGHGTQRKGPFSLARKWKMGRKFFKSKKWKRGN